MNDINDLSTCRTRLYVDLLQSLALEDPSLQDVVLDIALGSAISELDNAECSMPPANNDCNGTSILESTHILTKDEMLRYGTPARHLLNESTRQRLLTKLQTTLKSITDFFYSDIGEKPPNDAVIDMAQSLPEAIKLEKDQIESLNEEIKTLSYRLIELMVEAANVRTTFSLVEEVLILGDLEQKNKELDNDLTLATTSVFPAYDAARTASIDLLAAEIEASLIKLSRTKARFERTLYNYQPGPNRNTERKNVAQAIATAFGALKKDEKEMETENRSLDRQLEEYETLLNLVDGGSGGYQQIVNDWTKVKQETDECLKDLRRLGWTGD